MSIDGFIVDAEQADINQYFFDEYQLIFEDVKTMNRQMHASAGSTVVYVVKE